MKVVASVQRLAIELGDLEESMELEADTAIRR
jgi:hypothetical protein